jgi:TrmH family RNA methyltransferase
LVSESEQGEVAMLFGGEQSGMSNEEIDRCQYLVQIPTNPEYGSLNLAAAVQIISYEILVMHGVMPGKQRHTEPVPDHVPVTADEMERFYEHLEQTLVALDFLDPENPRRLMRRLRRLYNRARPDENEVNILRGMLSAAQHGNSEKS